MSPRPTSRPVRGAWAGLVALGLALSACGGRSSGPNAAFTLRDSGGFESGPVTDVVESADAGLDAATDAEADARSESETVTEADAGNLEASLLDSGGEGQQDATTGRDGA